MVNALQRFHLRIGALGVVLLAVLAATGAFMQGQWIWQAYQTPLIEPRRSFPSAQLPALPRHSAQALQRAGQGQPITGFRLRVDGATVRADVSLRVKESDMPTISPREMTQTTATARGAVNQGAAVTFVAPLALLVAACASVPHDRHPSIRGTQGVRFDKLRRRGVGRW